MVRTLGAVGLGCGLPHGMISAMADRRLLTEALARAVEMLEAGTWQQAHEIVQKDDSALGAWLHGIVPTLEGGLDSAVGRALKVPLRTLTDVPRDGQVPSEEAERVLALLARRAPAELRKAYMVLKALFREGGAG